MEHHRRFNRSELPLTRKVHRFPIMIRKKRISISASKNEFLSRRINPRKIQPVSSPTLNISSEEIEEGKCIGRGKCGRVLVGRVKDEILAVKITPIELQKYARNEWAVIKYLRSPFIVTPKGYLENERNSILLMELVDGKDLFSAKRKRRFKLREVVFITAEVVLALEYLHERKVVYRDMKPENIMVDENGFLKLIDFGLSKIMSSDRTFTVCGSPEYMAPEVINKTGHSYAADWWGVGILVYELLCGKKEVGHPPFRGDNFYEISEEILTGFFGFSQNVDPVSRDFICELLVENPKNRLGGDLIKAHRFFRDIDWRNLERKYNSPFYNNSIF